MRNKPKKFLRGFLFLFLISQLSIPVYADENQFISFDFCKRVFNDFKEMPTKPATFSKTEWLIAGGFVLGTLGALPVDGEIQKQLARKPSVLLDDLSANFTHFGDYKYQAPLILGSWFIGTISNYTPLKKCAADGAEASLFAAGIVTPLINRITGRALPNSGEPALKFRPFTPHRYSFPSGHTTEAFAMATVIDINFREVFGYWHTPIVYSIATATGIARMYDQRHYFSEVILGAGIGWSIGRWIASKPRNQSGPSFSLSDTGTRLVCAWKF